LCCPGDAEAAIGRVERACVGRFLRGKQSKLYFLGVVVRASCPLDEPRRMRFTVDAGGPLPAGDGDAPRFVELAQGQVSNDCVGDAEFAAWCVDRAAFERRRIPTSKAPLSAVFHSFRLIFGRAIISRNGLEAWMFFPERARAEHSC